MAESAGRQRGRSGSAGKTGKSASPERKSRVESSIAQNMTNLDFLRGLIDAVDQSGIDSLEISRSGTRIRIAKTPDAAAVHTVSYPQTSGQAAPAAPAALAAPAPSAELAAPAAGAGAEVAAAPPASNLVDVKSPMVGTFYRSPAPEAPSYVEIGSSVSAGQTLCILEAMKLMNELECEQDGVIREILVEDADPVEYGQVLFRIEPS